MANTPSNRLRVTNNYNNPKLEAVESGPTTSGPPELSTPQDSFRLVQGCPAEVFDQSVQTITQTEVDFQLAEAGTELEATGTQLAATGTRATAGTQPADFSTRSPESPNLSREGGSTDIGEHTADGPVLSCDGTGRDGPGSAGQKFRPWELPMKAVGHWSALTAPQALKRSGILHGVLLAMLAFGTLTWTHNPHKIETHSISIELQSSAADKRISMSVEQKHDGAMVSHSESQLVLPPTLVSKKHQPTPAKLQAHVGSSQLTKTENVVAKRATESPSVVKPKSSRNPDSVVVPQQSVANHPQLDESKPIITDKSLIQTTPPKQVNSQADAAQHEVKAPTPSPAIVGNETGSAAPYVASAVRPSSASGPTGRPTDFSEAPVTRAHGSLVAQQASYDAGESYKGLLEKVFSDVEAGIASARTRGDNATAEAMKTELQGYKALFASSTSHISTKSPLQMVTVGRGESHGTWSKTTHGKASVVVTYSEAPVTLALRATENTDWKVKVAPNAQVKEIVLINAQGCSQTVAGMPANTRITNIEEQGLYEGTASPHQYQLETFHRRAKVYTGMDLASIQGEWNSTQQPWVVGPESEDWRAQMVLNQIGSLHERATKAVKEDVIAWMNKVKVPISYFGHGGLSAVDGSLHLAELISPKKYFDFLPGVIEHNWNPPADAVINAKDQFAVSSGIAPGYAQEKVLTLGDKRYGVYQNGVFSVNSIGVVKNSQAPNSFSPNNFDFTIDTKRNRLLVKSGNNIFAVDPNLTEWKNAFGLRHWEQRARSDDNVIVSVHGMSYCEDDDCIYFLEASDSPNTASRLMRYSAQDGQPLQPVKLNYWLRISGSGGTSFTEMIYCKPYLVAVTAAPLEAGNVYVDDIKGRRYDQRDLRQYANVIDPHSGKLLFSAPLGLPTGDL